jgi:hypothetical protein
MKLYVYCIAEAMAELIDKLPDSLNGISGSKARLINSGNFSIVVSDFAGDVVPVTRENALTHAAVVRSMLDQTTPLPFRFGTLATEQELESYVTARQAALQAKLEVVRNCVEMSVKIIWDRIWLDEPADDNASEEKPGTAFLAQKRREILQSEGRTAEAKKVAAWLQERVNDLVRETRIDMNPTEKLLVTAAHLVARDSVQQYRARLAEARAQRRELHFLVSGPWAPYSFANIDLEFKTQFGVS